MLKIGDFSRLARVTVKALRHYERVGLLPPFHVDQSAGYRYYSPDQLLTLNRILLLKELGFELKEIRRLLRNSDAIPAALRKRRSDLQAEIGSAKSGLRRLEILRGELGREANPVPILVRDVATETALTAREVVRDGDGRITELFERLEVHAARSRIRADRSPFLLFHDPPDADQLGVEVCVPVKSQAQNQRGVRMIPGCPAAGSIVYRGPYEQTRPLFVSLARWVDANGGCLIGPLREVYHRYGADGRGYSLEQSAGQSSGRLCDRAPSAS